MSKWNGVSVLTFLKLSCNRQQVCIVVPGQFLFSSTLSRLASREWPHGDSANFHGLGAHLFSLLGSRNMRQGNCYLPLVASSYPVLLSWWRSQLCSCRHWQSKLERAVAGVERGLISQEGAMGRVEWSVGYGNPEMWLSSSYVTWARETQWSPYLMHWPLFLGCTVGKLQGPREIIASTHALFYPAVKWYSPTLVTNDRHFSGAEVGRISCADFSR